MSSRKNKRKAAAEALGAEPVAVESAAVPEGFEPRVTRSRRNLSRSEPNPSVIKEISEPTTKRARTKGTSAPKEKNSKSVNIKFTKDRARSWFLSLVERDPESSKEGKKRLGPSGLQLLGKEIDKDVDKDIVFLILAWKMEAKDMGWFTEEEWLKGMTALQVDNNEKLVARWESLRQLLDNKETFRSIYRFAYDFTKGTDNGFVRHIEVEEAQALFKLFLEKRWGLCNAFCEFLSMNKLKTINKDQFNNVLEFHLLVKDDCSDYDTGSAWPVLMDEFVAHIVSSKHTLQDCALPLMDSSRLEKPTKEEDSSLLEAPLKADDGTRLEEDGSRLEKPMKQEDSSRLEGPMNEEDASRLEAPLKADDGTRLEEDGSRLEKPMKQEDSSRLEGPMNEEDASRLEAPLKADDGTRLEEDGSRLEEPVKEEDSSLLEGPLKADDGTRLEEPMKEEDGSRLEKPMKQEDSSRLEGPRNEEDASRLEAPLKADDGTRLEEPMKDDDGLRLEDALKGASRLELENDEPLKDGVSVELAVSEPL